MVNCEIIDKRSSSFYIAGAYQQPKILEKKASMEETGADSQIIDLITQYQSKLFAYVYSQTTDPEATREILQETCIVTCGFQSRRGFNSHSAGPCVKT